MWLDPVTRRLLRDVPARRPVILMYHSITRAQGRSGWPWSVTLKDFRQQMQLLREFGWTTVHVNDISHPERLPERTVAVTFDDGYRDNMAACEVLLDEGLTATWFVVSGDVGKQASWQDSGAPPERPLLSSGQLLDMKAQGFEIGAHGKSHRCLIQLDDAAMEEEVSDSKQSLEDMLGCEVSSFAYPYGDHDDRVVAAVANAGYRQACTCITGWALKNTGLLRLRRIPVLRNDSLATFVRKLVFAEAHFSGWRLAGYYLRRLGCR